MIMRRDFDNDAKHWWYFHDFDETMSIVLPFGKEGGQGRHPTQKPVALFEYLIKIYSNPGEVVFDPFIGRGRRPSPR